MNLDDFDLNALKGSVTEPDEAEAEYLRWVGIIHPHPLGEWRWYEPTDHALCGLLPFDTQGHHYWRFYCSCGLTGGKRATSGDAREGWRLHREQVGLFEHDADDHVSRETSDWVVIGHDPWANKWVRFGADSKRDAESMLQHLVVRGLTDLTIEEC